MLIGSCLLFFAGCVLFPGEIEEGLPRLRDKLPETTKVFLACPRNAGGGYLNSRNARVLANEFKAAFAARGIAVKLDERKPGTLEADLMEAATNGCEVAVCTQVLAWNYGDAGFSGKGNRDEVLIAVMLMRPETRRVITRAKLHVTNGIGRSAAGGTEGPGESIAPIIYKYVNSLFPPKEDS